MVSFLRSLWHCNDTKRDGKSLSAGPDDVTLLLTAIHRRDVAGAMSMGPRSVVGSVYTASCYMYPASLGMRYRTRPDALAPPVPPDVISIDMIERGQNLSCAPSRPQHQRAVRLQLCLPPTRH